MYDDSLYFPLNDPRHSQAYINAMNAMGTIDRSTEYNLPYHHSIIDDDKINDSIKIRCLYNELMKLRDSLSNSQKRLIAEIDVLQDKNKKLEDEIASIKQALYFG